MDEQSPRNFDKIESEINLALNELHSTLSSDLDRLQYYSDKFDRKSEEGFYNEGQRAGQGEKPTWEPNPAYMESLEDMWKPIESILEREGLRLEESLREAFFDSREYKDFKTIHRRVFSGQILEITNSRSLTCYLLTVPHSHEKFEYVVAPTIYFSKALRI